MSESDDDQLQPWGFPPLSQQVQSPMTKAMRVLAFFFDAPVTWFKVNVVDKYRPAPYPYYHKKFRKVPAIDECYIDDYACIYEADNAFKRQRQVDFEILKILNYRFNRCLQWNRNINEWDNAGTMCLKEREVLHQAEINAAIKYGELGPTSNVIDAYMKQKHRLIWERRQKEKDQSSIAA
ncbi:NADH dehydrogenase [ubiquinone] 1 beta subcomplex subunit 10 [Sarcoptes scabiei]|uniref:NADH dehydrogenase [ubiquinone] 1 beta subcomplex subunit 10 n=1 Tax=Sarcoptes scabiei TaxID=52283 RepID=A0A834VD80_SARSC|nr:NADH dehydrogenase [ubiquinone] 1 beta subcomplex subunit 10 [Sarcoptes scabiei]